MKPPRVSVAWVLFAAALMLRVGWVIHRWTTRGPAFDYPDEDLHWQLATHLVRDGVLVSDDGRYAARMPLYPLFLALFAGLGSTGILIAKLAQAALGAVATIVGYRLANAALGRRAAVVAGVFIACDPFGIFFANLLLTEAPFTLLALGLTACVWSVLATSAKNTPLMGLALLGPAAILTRPSAVVWVLLLWLLLAWLLVRGRRASTASEMQAPSGAGLVVRLLVCPLVLAALMLPWGLRNRAVLGSFAWLSTNGGVTLYDAQGPQADGSSDQRFLHDTPDIQGLSEVALDQTLQRRALEQMWNHPANVLRLAGVKFARTWSPVPHVAEYRNSPAAAAGAAYTVLLLLGALAGLGRAVAARRRLPVFLALIWLPVVYFTAVHCIYIGSVRYRVPLLPLLSLGAGAACKRPINEQCP